MSKKRTRVYAKAERTSSNQFIIWCLQNGHEAAVAKDLENIQKRKEEHLIFLEELAKEKPENFVTDKREYYRGTYLKSEHWKELRASKLKLNPRCERCGNKNRIEPHHKQYRNLYDVTVEDLETLCRGCHIKEHQILSAK